MSENKIGTVTLIGAGCGKDLITLKGLNALRCADVVVYDSLIDKSLLSGLDAKLIYVGKRAGKHSAKQDEINEILIKYAKLGLNVARLKGGDSFVFGRGGEEILALKNENIPFDLIPGVSSAVAVPENFGIPVTHRKISRSFTVVTGHTADDSQENYSALAKLDGTLVFLMGLYKIKEICGRLIEHGKDKDTPAALLCRGFASDERRINGTLATIPELAKDAKTPSILVVGDSASLDFKRTFPSVAVTGTKAFCDKFSRKYPETVTYPYVDIKDTDFKYDLNDYDVVAFTSQNAIDIFFSKIDDIRDISRLKFACVGPATAKRLKKYKINADYMPDVYDKKSMLEALPKERTLVLGKDNLYKTVIKKSDINTAAGYIVFSSPAAVKGFYENGGELNNTKAVCIGNTTAKELSKHTDNYLTALNHTINGIIEVIENEAFQKAQNE